MSESAREEVCIREAVDYGDNGNSIEIKIREIG